MLRIVLLSLGIVFASCSAAPAGENLAPASADSLIRADASRKNFVLVDVRTPEEFATGHIKGAKLIDFHAPDFQTRLSTLPRDGEILLYCRSGNRSGQALSVMKDMGFTDARHVAGGINAWRVQGLPVDP